LPTSVGWDSHNYVTMAIDSGGFIHLSGNMHCVPLIYFRTTKPYDIRSFERVPSMSGRDEKSCTYPVFLRGPRDELIFTYRNGRSGSGDQIYNIYDEKTRTWRRLLEQPLTSGKGKMNAYLHGPVRDKNGLFHLCWVWRNTPDCATNHDLSYARSKDLVHWTTSDGKPLALPITVETTEIVDPVPPGGGMINGNTVIGFDSKGRLIVSYHKFDEKGMTQLFNARLEKGGWKIYQTSQWNYRWEFGGGGSIEFEIRVGPVQVGADGRLTQSYSHIKHGSGVWILDEETLKPVGRAARAGRYPRQLSRPVSKSPGMRAQQASDLGSSDEPGVNYVLRWETLGPNRDRPRDSAHLPTMLRLVKVRAE
ncbi:BNR repeat-containing protein, partial [Candidatus Sumerlaeota bacterium]|nr:BNR repeat-containing protein [Candidatus Sumerlaeota bacterium]